MSKKIFLALGSNLGERQRNLEDAITAVSAAGLHIGACSSLYETEPRDVADQPWFLNMVIACDTNLFPRQVLSVTQRVERQLGRVRRGVVPRGPRLIDIDILLFGREVLADERLTIPHPRMSERRFVLEPLCEIAPALRHPVSHELFSRQLLNVQNQIVKKLGAATCPPLPR